MDSVCQAMAMTSENQESRKSETRCCHKCKKVCDKLLQLPECGHRLCKRCLNDHSSSLSSWTTEPDYFSCPVCGEKVTKPDYFPIGKRSKAFNIKTKATFYTTDCNVLPAQKEIDNTSDSVEEKETGKFIGLDKKARRSSDTRSGRGEIDTGSDFVKVRETSIGKSKSLHRTAMRFSSSKCTERFDSKISSDGKDCLYFGGDIMPNGDIILADWLNFSLKLFEPSGQFICNHTLEEAPLDITVVRNDMIAVSFGSACREVMFITYVKSSKVLDKLGCNRLPGFLYSTTKYEDSCLGIFERDGNSPSIVRLNFDVGRAKSGSSRRTVTDFIITDSNTELSSESGIFYNQQDSRLYVTSRRKLLCFKKDKKLMFKNSFECVGTDLYFLGSVTCDDKGVTYVASDNCILRLNKVGELIAVIPTEDDPYHILMGKDKRDLVLIGKQNDVVCHKFAKQK